MFRGAFSIVGVVNDNDPTKYGMRVNGNWMLGSVNDLPEVIKKNDVGVILSAGMSPSREINEFIFDLCQENHIRLFFLNDLMLMVDRQITQPRGSFEYPIWLDERLEYKAMHNAITGLPNRYLFQDRLKHSLAYAKRYETLLAVLLIKVEGLRTVNEEIGRKYGDAILMELSERLKKCERESDTLAYVGENLFAVILQNISEESVSEMVARKMLAALSEPFKAEKMDIQLRAEIKIYTDSAGYNGLETLSKIDLTSAYTGIQTKEVLKWYDKALDR
jgi:diguanylate cyclase (GGDEF)-like protein